MKTLSVILLLTIACISVVAQNQPLVVYPPSATQPANKRVTGVNDVIRLSKAGVTDAVIIAQIKKCTQPIDLTADQLIELKSAHVSDAVIEQLQLKSPPVVEAALTEPSTQSVAPRTTTPSNAKVEEASLPSEPGMCVVSSNNCKRVFGQIGTFERTGSRLVNWITADIKAAHDNVQILGPHAQTVVDRQPVFYFTPSNLDAQAGIDAGELLLLRLETKPHRRQFEVKARGTWRASTGVTPTHQLQLVRSEEAHDVYKVTPAAPLSRGEYALYLVRGDGKSPFIYDFSVE